jgi:hypothetical protein
VAGVEHPRETFFVMPKVPMHHVHAKVEEQQGQWHCQPFQWLNLMHGAPESANGQQPEKQHKSAVQPWVVERMNISAVAGAESFGGLPHCVHLFLLLSPAD